jgi:integrase
MSLYQKIYFGMEKKFFVYPKNQDLAKRWFIRFNENGNRKTIWVESFNSLESRLEAAQSIVAALRDGTYHAHSVPNPKTDIGARLWARLEEKRPSLRRKSWHTFSSAVKFYLTYLESHSHTNEVGQLYLNSLHDAGRSASTINKARTVLKSLYATLVKRKECRFNPFEDTLKAKGGSTGASYFKKTQIVQLKKAILADMPFLWNPIGWIYYCFIRPGELRQMKVGDVDFDEWKVQIRAEISKNRKTQWVLIPDAFKKELERLCLYQYDPNMFLIGKDGLPSQEQLSYNWLSRHHLTLLRSLNYTSAYCLYSWKHTGVCTAYRNGMGIRQLQLQLRHHSLDMVEVYLKSLGILEIDGIRQNSVGI